MPGERFPQAMWCINEDCGCAGLSCLLTLSVGFFSSHVVGEARGRSGVRRISGPCGSMERLDLGSGSLTRVVVTSLQQSHVNDWWAVTGVSRFCLLIKSAPIWNITKQKRTISHFPLSCSEGSGYNANGHSPGTPAGRKASNHINVNSWPLPVDWLLTDGGELFVMCLTSLKLTQINLRPSHHWLQGSARWSLMRTVKNNGWM